MALRSAGFCLDTGGELTAQMGNIEKSGAAHRHGWEGKQVKNSILKFLKRIALAAVAICLLLCLFLTGILVYGSARRYVTKKDTVHAFYAQYAAFVEASEEDSGGGIFSDILNFNREGDLPQEIQEMGFESVYFDDGVAYFTHKDASAWTGSFGILRTADTKNVPSWYILEPIEREWYYWRMA